MQPRITVVLPTWNEALNIAHVLVRVMNATSRQFHTTILVVDDDSTDGTLGEVEHIRSANPAASIITWEHARERPRGLTQAILDGLQRAETDIVVVCDADGQHQYELIPDLVAGVHHHAIAIGARTERRHNQLPVHRRALAWAARKVARGRTARSQDPMSGFFAVDLRRITLRETMFPKGYKALSEILSWNPDASVLDVPARLTQRMGGTSKVTVGVIWNSLRQAWCAR